MFGGHVDVFSVTEHMLKVAGPEQNGVNNHGISFQVYMHQ